MTKTYHPDQKWPPAPYDIAQKKMHEWGVWYTADLDELPKVYNRATRKNTPFFWGKKNTQEVPRRHFPAASNISRASSDLLFATVPQITPAEPDTKNTALTERLDLIFGADNYGNKLSEAAETCSAFGGVYLRAWWDEEIADHVIPSHIDADSAVPEFRYDKLTAVTFWTVVSAPDENRVIRHLERHEKGMIYHSLYEGDESKLGTKIPLDKHPATEWAVDLVDANGGIATGIDELAVVYVPNVKPARGWRSTPGLKQLGRSDYEGLEGEFDALDEVYSSWLRDIELAKARLLVDELLLDDLGPGRGGLFDTEKSIFTRLKPTLGDDGGATIEQVQFQIRWQEHAQTVAEILGHILYSCGLSAQQFSNGTLSVGNVTATEVNSRNSIVENTRKKKLNYWRAGLAEFVRIVMELDAIHFGTGLKLTDNPIITFHESPHQSPLEQAQTIASRRQAGIESRRQAIKEINPTWGPEEVDAEIEAILEDLKTENEIAFGGGGGDEGGDTDLTEDVDGVPDEPEEFAEVLDNIADNLDEAPAGGDDGGEQ